MKVINIQQALAVSGGSFFASLQEPMTNKTEQIVCVVAICVINSICSAARTSLSVSLVASVAAALSVHAYYHFKTEDAPVTEAL